MEGLNFTFLFLKSSFLKKEKKKDQDWTYIISIKKFYSTFT